VKLRHHRFGATRSISPISNGSAFAIVHKFVVSRSSILSESVRTTDHTASSAFFGSRGRKNRTSFLSCRTGLKAFARKPTSPSTRLISSSNTSQSRLVKMSGRMNSLDLAASFAAAMEQAAAQI
jgi:hypothetical protein